MGFLGKKPPIPSPGNKPTLLFVIVQKIGIFLNKRHRAPCKERGGRLQDSNVNRRLVSSNGTGQIILCRTVLAYILMYPQMGKPKYLAATHTYVRFFSHRSLYAETFYAPCSFETFNYSFEPVICSLRRYIPMPSGINLGLDSCFNRRLHILASIILFWFKSSLFWFKTSFSRSLPSTDLQGLSVLWPFCEHLDNEATREKRKKTVPSTSSCVS